mmetsp:Transcript_6174/g.13642  ORF Transcript_6174/g.13642 Transcript_6174/m.13642 type:complete len:90 (+) Transcript_6174:785-1054(+)
MAGSSGRVCADAWLYEWVLWVLWVLRLLERLWLGLCALGGLKGGLGPRPLSDFGWSTAGPGMCVDGEGRAFDKDPCNDCNASPAIKLDW